MRALVACGLAASACGTTAERPPYQLDCSVEDRYDIKVLESYELSSISDSPTWYSFGDNTPDSGQSGQDGGTLARSIEGGGRCGSKRAIVLGTHGHNDYGSGFGDYHVGTDYTYPVPVDASGYEGISFWARSPAVAFNGVTTPSTKGVTLSLSDADSTYVSGWDAGKCLDYSDSGANAVQVVDQNGNFVSGGTATNVRPADACGNTFDQALLTTDRWQFYTLPFSSFAQTADPSRVAGGFDHTLFTIGIRFPKEARGELWLDDIGLYRKAAGPHGNKVYADEMCTKMPDDGVITDFATRCTDPDGGFTSGACFGGPNSSGVSGGSYGFGGPGVDDTSNMYCPSYASQSTFVGAVTDMLASEAGPSATPADASAPVTQDAGASGSPSTITSVPLQGEPPKFGMHLRGKVASYAGGGIFLGHCMDASQFSGVEFVIWSTNGTDQIQLQATQRINREDYNGGSCLPDEAGAYSCAPAQAIVPITATPSVVRVPWGAFHGGKPVDGFSVADSLIQFQWQIDWNCGARPPFDVDVRIADVKLFK